MAKPTITSKSSEYDKFLVATADQTIREAGMLNEIAARPLGDRMTELAIEQLTQALESRVECLESALETYASFSVAAITAHAEDAIQRAEQAVDAAEAREAAPALRISCTWAPIRYSSWQRGAVEGVLPEGVRRLVRHHSGRVRVYGSNLHGRTLVLNGVDRGVLRERGSRGIIFDTAE